MRHTREEVIQRTIQEFERLDHLVNSLSDEDWNSLLAWPENGAGDQGRPRRVAGSWVILVKGILVLYVAPGGRQILTFPGDGGHSEAALRDAFEALSALPKVGRRRLLVVEKVDNVPVHTSSHLPLLTESGFVKDYRGMTPAPRAGS